MCSATAVATPNRTPLIALLSASAISLTGSRLTLVAVPWFVLQTTGSAARTGITGAAGALAYVVAAFFGGALVDRFGFRRTSICADIASGVAIAMVPLLSHTIGLAFWELLALVFLSTFFNTPGSTARRVSPPIWRCSPYCHWSAPIRRFRLSGPSHNWLGRPLLVS